MNLILCYEGFETPHIRKVDRNTAYIMKFQDVDLNESYNMNALSTSPIIKPTFMNTERQHYQRTLNRCLRRKDLVFAGIELDFFRESAIENDIIDVLFIFFDHPARLVEKVTYLGNVPRDGEIGYDYVANKQLNTGYVKTNDLQCMCEVLWRKEGYPLWT